MISKGNIRRLVLLATIQCAAMALTACGDKEDKKVVEGNTPLLTSKNIGLNEKNEQADKKAEHQKLLSEIFGKEGFDLKIHPNGENKEGYLQQDAVAHLDSGEMFDKVTLDDKPL